MSEEPTSKPLKAALDAVAAMDATAPLHDVLEEIGLEVEAAESMWPAFNSAHEGFAVLHEEFDELKKHVWTNQARRDLDAMRSEAIQVAAMAVRFVRDICDGERGRT